MTNLNRVAIQCVNDSKHRMFKETDGARCVECEGIMNPIPVSEEEYRLLPSYNKWHEQQNKKKKHKVYEIKLKGNRDKIVCGVSRTRIEDGFLLFLDGNSNVLFGIEAVLVFSYELIEGK